MSRLTAHPVARTLIAVTACLGVLAVLQRTQDNDSSAATPGLSATFSGRAFAAGPGGGAPVMHVRGLRQGQATSGAVTVRNPGPATRYFWLSPGRVSERLGASGGRLTSAVALTVMDVTDISSPAVIYRGALGQLGARPLGFLAPGARRSFSFVAELPTGGRSPVAPSVDPYRGASVSVAWTWHSLAARPAARTAVASPVRKSRDRKPPKLAFSVPPRQQLLKRRELTLTARCDEDCATRAKVSMRSGGRTWSLGVRQGGGGLQPSHALSVRFSGAQTTALRSAMVGGRPTTVRVDLEAFDRSGNRGRDSHTITLRAKR